MKLRKSYLQDDGLRMVQYEWWPYNVADVCDFAFGQCEHVNSSMMSDLQWYWWLFIGQLQYLFCTVFALYFFDDCIACTATAQKGV